MKILVAYFSETGNTKRIAEAIGEEATAGGHEVCVKVVGKVGENQMDDYDILFVGSTCHSSDLAAPVKQFLSRIPDGAKFKLAGFVTHSTVMPERDARQKELYERWAGKCPITFDTAAKEKGVDFLGFFHCQGAPSPPIEEFIRQSVIPNDEEWEEYIAEARKHPTSEDVDDARVFARDVLSVSPQ